MKAAKFFIFIRQNIPMVFIFLAALIARIIYLSPWLEDWDSAQFAIAIHNYSVVDNLPHPPGYPIYILFAKFLNLLTNNDTLTLGLLSVIFGSLSVIIVYIFAKKLFNTQAAILSSLFFITIPVHWDLSTVGLSNIPGLFFLLLASYFMYTNRENLKGLVIV